MTKPLIDTTLPIVDGHGRKVVILHTLVGPEHTHPLLCVVTLPDGTEEFNTFTLQGEEWAHGESPADLRNVAPSKWLNVFEPNGRNSTTPKWRDSRQDADQAGEGPLSRLGLIELQDGGKLVFHDLTVQA